MFIAPAGGYPPFKKFIRQNYKSNLCLEKLFEQEVLFCTSSGKSALLAVLFALRKLHSAKKVIVPSYGCPDLVTASARAGFKVELAPINPETLQMDKDFLLSADPKEYAAIIFANLYGMPDEIPTGIDSKILVIDDLCQSLLSKKNKRIGISLLSAGRGKSLCGIGGGGVILKRGDDFSEKVFNLALSETNAWQNLDLVSQLKSFLISILAPTLEKPEVFKWLLPYLSIGEVVIDFDFETKKISRYQNSYAAYQYQYSEASKVNWVEYLKQNDFIQPYLNRSFENPIHLIRYPVLLPSQELRDKAVKSLYSYGVSASYKKSLMDYEELKESIVYNQSVKPLLGLLTLPVHRYVNEEIINQISKVLKEI